VWKPPKLFGSFLPFQGSHLSPRSLSIFLTWQGPFPESYVKISLLLKIDTASFPSSSLGNPFFYPVASFAFFELLILFRLCKTLFRNLLAMVRNLTVLFHPPPLLSSSFSQSQFLSGNCFPAPPLLFVLSIRSDPGMSSYSLLQR